MADFGIDWSAAPNPNALSDMSTAAMQGAQQGQALRGISALHGIDISDPGSINQGIANLVRAGAADQASALMGLQLQRFKNSALVHAINTPLIPPSPSQNEAPADPGAQQQAVLGQAKSAVDALIAIPAGPARDQQFATVKAGLVHAGMQPDYIDHMVPDPNDTAHLQSISSTLANVLDHPQFGGTNPNADLTPHPRSAAFGQAPNYASNPDVINAVAQRENLGLPVAETGKLLATSQGYTGALSPGQEAAFGGQPTTQAPYAPINPSPGQPTIDPNTGQQIAPPPAFPASISNVGPAETPVVLNPNTGGTNIATNSGASPSSTSNAAPVKFEPGTVMPSTQAAEMLHNPGAFFGKLLGSNGVQVTSAARTPEHNAAVGGVPNSEHIPGNGTAYDFKVPPGMTNQQAVARIVASGVPFDQLIDEGSHIHFGIGPQMRGQVLNLSARSQGAQIAGKTLPSPAPIPGGNGLYQPDFTGKVSQVSGTGMGPGEIVSKATGDPAVSSTKEALTNYNAMAQNASTLTGPAALGMMENMTRAYSGLGARPQGIAALMNTFGIAPKLQGQFQQALEGKGPLTPEMRQQLLDASYNLLKAHYGVAQQTLQGYRSAATTANSDPGVLDKVLPGLPHHYYVTPPPASARVRGAVIDSPKGELMWNGSVWIPARA